MSTQRTKHMNALRITWTVSRGRETEGWNICTITDENGKKYRTCGGGYDMQGTVFANWLWDNYRDRIIKTCRPIDYDQEDYREQYHNADYGFFTKGGKFWLDGGCGMSSITSIAKKIGLKVRTHWNERKKCTDLITIEEETA